MPSRIRSLSSGSTTISVFAIDHEFAGHARDRAYAGNPDGHRFDIDLAERLEVTADR